MFIITSVVVDSNGNTIGIRVSNNGNNEYIKMSQRLYGAKFDNAIITKDGVVRAKLGHIPRERVSSVQRNKNSNAKDSCIKLIDYVNNKLYDGVSNKLGITYNGIDYIVKFNKSEVDTSAISEHVASRFINNLGYKAHETRLEMSDRGVCVFIEDFSNKYGTLHPYKDTKQSSEGTDISTKGYTYKDIQYMIKMHTKIPDELKRSAILQFWDMFFLDAILGNRDRHMGNWGYIERSGRYRVAPLYDNGGSLFPGVLKVIDKYKSNRVDFVFERSERFPASVIMSKTVNGELKRTNFYDFINDNNLSKCTPMRISYQKFIDIGVNKVRDAICSAVKSRYIMPELKQFYIDVVVSRYLHIIQRLDFYMVKDYL